MSVSPYIARLVAREKKEQAAYRDATLDRVLEWHQKRVGELDSAIAGIQNENATKLKYRAHRQMHEMTLIYLRRAMDK